MLKCHNSYCVPYHRVCDGYIDCPQGDDEILCGIPECIGGYLCHNSRVCLHPTEVCDGVSHCPERDDEAFCIVLPDICQSLASSIFCKSEKSESIISQLGVAKMVVKFLTIHSLLPYPFVLQFPSLLSLNISHCDINWDISHSFQNLTHLIFLDLSHNMIESFGDMTFSHVFSLHKLILSHNKIKYIPEGLFRDMQYL